MIVRVMLIVKVSVFVIDNLRQISPNGFGLCVCEVRSSAKPVLVADKTEGEKLITKNIIV
jgi:hypothetical protein